MSEFDEYMDWLAEGNSEVDFYTWRDDKRAEREDAQAEADFQYAREN